MSSRKLAAKHAVGKAGPKMAAKSAARAADDATQKPGAKEGVDAAAASGGPQGTSARAAELARDLEAALMDGQSELLAPEAIQALMAALLKTYTARVQAQGEGHGDYFPPLASVTSVTPTDVMVTASALLKAADLQVFELGMWQSWTGH